MTVHSVSPETLTLAPRPVSAPRFTSPHRSPIMVSVSPVPTAIPDFADERLAALSVPRSPAVQLHAAPPVTDSAAATNHVAERPAPEPVPSPGQKMQKPATTRSRPVLPDTEELVRRGRAEQIRQVERNLLSIVRIVGQACIEVEMGLRSAPQLEGWMVPELVQKIKLRASLRKAVRHQQPTPKHVRVTGARLSPTAFGAYEACATVQVGSRVRAVALRLERHRNRWRVAALEMG